MTQIIKWFLTIATISSIVVACDNTTTHAQETSVLRIEDTSSEWSAKDVRGCTPYSEVKNEPAPKLFVDPPLPEGLAQGIVWIQWRVENLNVVPVFGKGAVNISPRVGHLHVHVDDLGWWWADPSNVNTIDIAGLTEGPHKVRIELVNTNHEPFPGQSKTVAFTIPKGASLNRKHHH